MQAHNNICHILFICIYIYAYTNPSSHQLFSVFWPQSSGHSTCRHSCDLPCGARQQDGTPSCRRRVSGEGRMVGILGIGVWRVFLCLFPKKKNEVWIHLMFHHSPTCCSSDTSLIWYDWYVWLQQRCMKRWFLMLVGDVTVNWLRQSPASRGSGQLWKRCTVRENNQVVARKKPRKTSEKRFGKQLAALPLTRNQVRYQ